MRKNRTGYGVAGSIYLITTLLLITSNFAGCGSTTRPLSPVPATGLVAQVGELVFRLEDPIIPPPRPTRNVYGRDLDTRGTEIVTVTYSGVSESGAALFEELVVANEWAPEPGHTALLTETTLGDREGRTRGKARSISVDLTDTKVLELRKVRIRIHSADSRRLVYDLRDVLWDR